MQGLQIQCPRLAVRSSRQLARSVTTKAFSTKPARPALRVVAVHQPGGPRLGSTCSSDREPVRQLTGPARQIGQKIAEYAKHGAKAVAVLGVAVLLLVGRCDAAHAARSAGRAGGFHAPSASRSYSGGGGHYSGGGGHYSSGLSGGMRSYSGGSYSSPYSGYRAPIIVPSPPIVVPGPPVVYGGPGVMVAPRTVVTAGPDIMDIVMISVFLVIAAGAATSLLRESGGVGYNAAGGGRPTLTRVQVGLVSLARDLKRDLDRIAARADTSSSRGLHHLLQEVVLALLRNPRYCIYGAASQNTANSLSSLENKFNSASVKERAKFEQETLVNVAGSAPRKSTYRPSSQGKLPDELVVVTLLVATSSAVNVPKKINSLQDLKQALQALGSVGSEEVLGVEVLWTPQAEGDYYTRDEIITDYPNLRQL